MFRKPKLNELVKFTAKNGDITYGMYRKVVGRITSRVYKIIANNYINIVLSWKDVKSWEYVDTKEKFTEYEEWRQKWIAENIGQLMNNETENFNKWIKDIKHVDALECYVNGLFFADGEIDNPSHTIARIFETGYAQALRDLINN